MRDIQTDAYFYLFNRLGENINRNDHLSVCLEERERRKSFVFAAATVRARAKEHIFLQAIFPAQNTAR